jgi:hypothetical protein
MALLRPNFRAVIDAQNAGNGVSEVQISKIAFAPDVLDYVDN